MTVPIIALTGRARSGKDTFAAELVNQGFRRYAFADTIKTIAAQVSGEPEHLFHSDATKDEYCNALRMTRRKAMQLIGTDMFREVFGPDVWVNCLLARWHNDGRPPMVVTDVRYTNEAVAMAHLGAKVIKLERPDNAGLSGEAGAHSSELGIAEYLVDVFVTNDGTIGELHAEARKLASYVKAEASL